MALSFPEGYDSGARRVPAVIRIDRRRYASFYWTEEAPDTSCAGLSAADEGGKQLRSPQVAGASRRTAGR